MKVDCLGVGHVVVNERAGIAFSAPAQHKGIATDLSCPIRFTCRSFIAAGSIGTSHTGGSRVRTKRPDDATD